MSKIETCYEANNFNKFLVNVRCVQINECLEEANDLIYSISENVFIKKVRLCKRIVRYRTY